MRQRIAFTMTRVGETFGKYGVIIQTCGFELSFCQTRNLPEIDRFKTGVG
jgi:hypothetical protein